MTPPKASNRWLISVALSVISIIAALVAIWFGK